ncbi:MAG: type II toxin-antitoxin system RelE/ParE family toxin [Planctomycetes bacterium]|nr:type II toxin-antitoxin system RelE/ParE family toxin [Planctomycetota bacterium]
MNRFTLSALARDDIERIAAFIARDNPAAAARVVGQFHIAARRLAQIPGIGHSRADLTDRPVLFWIVAGHRIVYRRTRGGIQIVRVIHGARDVGRVLEEE